MRVRGRVCIGACFLCLAYKCMFYLIYVCMIVQQLRYVVSMARDHEVCAALMPEGGMDSVEHMRAEDVSSLIDAIKTARANQPPSAKQRRFMASRGLTAATWAEARRKLTEQSRDGVTVL